MCYFAYEAMALSIWLCQNLTLGNNLHLISLWFWVGSKCVSLQELSLCLFWGVVLAPAERREGVSRQLRGK